MSSLVGSSVGTEALKTIDAINAGSPAVHLRLDFIAKHALNDAQVDLLEVDRETVRGWLIEEQDEKPAVCDRCKQPGFLLLYRGYEWLCEDCARDMDR